MKTLCLAVVMTALAALGGCKVTHNIIHETPVRDGRSEEVPAVRGPSPPTEAPADKETAEADEQVAEPTEG